MFRGQRLTWGIVASIMLGSAVLPSTSAFAETTVYRDRNQTYIDGPNRDYYVGPNRTIYNGTARNYYSGPQRTVYNGISCDYYSGPRRTIVSGNCGR